MGSSIVIVGAYREGACCKGACYKESGISSRVGIGSEVGISGRVGISSKAGIEASSSKDAFRSFRVPLLLHRASSIVYSRGVDK